MKRNILLLITSIIAALFLGELIVRFFHVAPSLISFDIDYVKSKYKSSPNPILGYDMKANYRDSDSTLHCVNFPETNSHGQRDIERAYKKPEGSRRVLLLGDSVVAGYGIRSLHNTISRELEKLLQKKSNIEVLNCGVDGYQTLAEVELLRTKGLKYSPDLCILVFDNSDFIPQNTHVLSCDSQVGFLARLLLKKSHLFRLAVIKFNLFGLGFRSSPAYRLACHCRLLSDSVETGMELLKKMSLKYGFDVFVAIWPRFSETNKYLNGVYDFYPGRGEVDKVMRIENICKKYNIDSYRLVTFFIDDYNNRLIASPKESSLPSINKLYTIGDSCHPNEYGTSVAAKGLEKILHERKFLY